MIHELNEMQLKAVHHLGSPLLVLAGAGSGKTRVITQKIEYLIKKCELAPHSILALTFTNKAAREMKERVNSSLAIKKPRGLKISTFHHFGLKFLRQEYKHLYLKANFSILDNEDQLKILKELSYKEFNADAKEQLNQILSIINRWKSFLIKPPQALVIAKDALEKEAALLYELYQKQLKIYNAVDFEDLIILPLSLLDSNPLVLEKWQNRIRYLLVDEYQDTNLAQYQLIKILCSPRGALTVVGDDHQSIYAWRGAHADNLLKIRDDFPNLTVIILEQNYRSTGTILKTANHLISHNPHHFKKNLWSNLGMGELIRVIACKDDEDETNRVCGLLLSLKFQKSLQFQDFAILYRSNHQARILEKALREHHIPYSLSGGTSFFSKTEVKDILCYLKILVNPCDDSAFLRVVNTPKREIGNQTLEKLREYATNRGLSLFEASFELGLEQSLSGKSLERLRYFVNQISLVADNTARGETFSVIQDFIKSIQYEVWLQETSSSPAIAEKRTKNMHELLSMVKRLLEDPNKPRDLQEVVNTLMLIDLLDRNEEEKPQDNVKLMTIHAAKGLEFSHVFIIGLEEELLPHKTSIEAEEIEEERRLCYVGLTRAKETLTLTYAKTRKRFNEIKDTEMSRFINELPPEFLNFEGLKKDQTAKEREQQANAHLTAIRALLNIN
ncbi:MAG: ATP-dependent helicase Rep [Francisellaceae bacterium]|nr:ATP-dependent helicase Rep [Francisellaceae bacterium]